MSGKRPKVTLEDAVAVTIRVEREDKWRLEDDDGTILAFLAWTADRGIFPLSTGGVSGPGIYVHVFDGCYRDEIRQWFLDSGYQSDLPVAFPQ